MSAALSTLDDLLSRLAELRAARDVVQFGLGDLLDDWTSHAEVTWNGSRAFWGQIASALRCSAGYARDLRRVARAIPQALREQYADADWSWFRECARCDDPAAACREYADLSVREIRARRTTRPTAGGGWTLRVPLSPAEVERYRRGESVATSVPSLDGGVASVSIKAVSVRVVDASA